MVDYADLLVASPDQLVYWLDQAEMVIFDTAKPIGDRQQQMRDLLGGSLPFGVDPASIQFSIDDSWRQVVVTFNAPNGRAFTYTKSYQAPPSLP